MSETAAAHASHEHHQELGFIRTYIFSLDHKMIGRQFSVHGPAHDHRRRLARDAGALAVGLAGNTGPRAQVLSPNPIFIPANTVAASFHRKLITPFLPCMRRS